MVTEIAQGFQPKNPALLPLLALFTSLLYRDLISVPFSFWGSSGKDRVIETCFPEEALQLLKDPRCPTAGSLRIRDTSLDPG